jgi:histidyl-tRNA synthetase
LAGLFTTRQLPGVGASFGLDRLSQLLADAGRLGKRSTVASVLIVNFQESDWAHYVRAGTELRSAGIAAEIYAEPKPMREQLGYASTRGHRLAVIIGPDEIQTSSFALRDLATRQQERGVPRVELASRVEAALRVAAVTPQ